MKPLLTVTQDVVTIDHGPFTDIRISYSSFRRWPQERIDAYHESVRRWETWGWLRYGGRIGQWVARRFNVPLSPPHDRSLTIEHSEFVG